MKMEAGLKLRVSEMAVFETQLANQRQSFNDAL